MLTKSNGLFFIISTFLCQDSVIDNDAQEKFLIEYVSENYQLTHFVCQMD
jgi:hypothetical protein